MSREQESAMQQILADLAALDTLFSNEEKDALIRTLQNVEAHRQQLLASAPEAQRDALAEQGNSLISELGGFMLLGLRRSLASGAAAR